MTSDIEENGSSVAESGSTLLAAIYQRALARVCIDAETGCHNWPGAKAGSGYGQIRDRGILYATHRVAYEAARGPIPAGFEIDHLCRNRACCNPAHLEAVTREENQRRGHVHWARVGRTGTCIHGHPYTPENTAFDAGSGARQCRTCRRERTNRNSRIRRARLRAARDLQVAGGQP